MDEKNIDLNFEIQPQQLWRDVAFNELQGKNPSDLSQKNKNGILIKPYYDISDLPEIIIQLPYSLDPYLGPREWHNMPKVIVNNVKEANEEAFSHLNGSANGILFELRSTECSPEALLKGIELTFCKIAFLASKKNNPFFQSFRKYAEKTFDINKISGSIFWDSQIDPSDEFLGWNGFKSLGIIIPADNYPNSIAQSLETAVGYVDQLTNAGWNPADALSQVSFLLTADTDFFMTIATHKVVRSLWFQITRAFNSTVPPLFIHSISPAWSSPHFEPHGNMIRQSTTALSCVLGGCNGLTIEPDNLNVSWRTARNVSAILSDETYIKEVSDPVAGSYFMESLTEELSRLTWECFQRI